MSRPTAFTKMQGLGNDFLVVDRRAARAPVTPDDARAFCDRHFGVGGDGVLSILPSDRAPLAMHVTNPDGSVAEMCGNGLRCVVLWAVDAGLLPANGGDVETGAGVLHCDVVDDPLLGRAVTVDMGAPVLDPRRIPMISELPRVIDVPWLANDRLFSWTAVSMGNPHAVTFLDDPSADLMHLGRTYGPTVELDPVFPNRTNVEFARLKQGGAEIDLVVWERGAGLTLACGTGACATVVAATVSGRLPEGSTARVNLPGGPLRIRVAPDLSRVWMTGPARRVFAGEVG